MISTTEKRSKTNMPLLLLAGLLVVAPAAIIVEQDPAGSPAPMVASTAPLVLAEATPQVDDAQALQAIVETIATQ